MDDHRHSMRTSPLTLWSRATGRGSVLRNGLAGAVATAVDFASVVAMVEALDWAPPLATAAGCIVGGITNFFVNRTWAFETDLPYLSQAVRYAVVSGLSAVLNAGLVAALLLGWPDWYQAVWIVARGLVFVGWNYPMHRYFVFTMGGARG